ncbi:MAG TPA: ABC transporter ATP-binding protein [Persephonella sp.]|uniref:Macrolide export ATP-binding/permease protein MacB n=1 Tax=Persephonella marina (strain DSM 14350 / EX-H1) TaxID=123214 RepID=C0QP72_PERMH|nr:MULTISPECIES: ABC transporter ATP-binding protein [Persephonella]ACO03886.1 macrolide export ATP-binding/permease protein MacB [Persephonella marina EX-H1]HCB69916.1 ABC transporter ATP-binding protein [Persephonella sp.]
MSILIKLENIVKEYESFGIRTKVLKGIDLTVRKGEFVSIMGVSGSGKTTLMNIIGCLDTPTSGKYYFEGMDVSDLDDDKLSEIRNEYIGFVFQQFYLINYLTVLENVIVPTIYSRKPPENPKDKAKKLLERVGLEEKLSFKPNQLSGGQQQRVAIARALINDPDLILADEPTGALDSKTASEIMDIFKELNREGKTIIVVTHDPKVAGIADRIIRIEDGKIID